MTSAAVDSEPELEIALARVLRACRLRQTPMPPGVACYVARALAYAGGGALDPAHVNLTADGTVELTDGSEGPIDLGSLGALLFECLVLRRVADEPIPPPSTLVEGIPPALDDIVRRLVAPAGDAFAGADELVAALDPVCAELGGDAAAMARVLVDLESALPRRAVVVVDQPSEGEESLGHNVTMVALRRTPSPRANAEAEVDARVWRRRWSITAVAVLVAFVLPMIIRALPSLFARPVAPKPTSATTPPPVTLAPAVTPDPVAPVVRLRVDGPAGALASVDDEPIGVLPLDVTLPASPQIRRLLVTQPGHRPWSRAIAGNMDVAVTVELALADTCRGCRR
jgi:hypothetical protein